MTIDTKADEQLLCRPESTRLARVNGVLERIQPVQGGTPTRKFLVTVSGRSYHIGRRLAEVLCSLPGCAAHLHSNVELKHLRLHEKWPEDERAAAVRILARAGLVTFGADTPACATAPTRRLWMFIRFTLMPEEAVAFAASLLTWLFNKHCLQTFGVATVCVMAYILWSNPLIVTEPYVLINSIYTSISLGDLCVLTTLLIASSLAHEIGHATAARALGANAGRIGAGVYIAFPVFFTDLNETWVLPNTKRAIVSIAGLYVQGIFVALTNVALLGIPSCTIIISIVDASYFLTALANLNPFLKFDGYWLLCDLTDTPNLATKGDHIANLLLLGLRSNNRRLRRRVIALANSRPFIERAYAFSRPCILALYFAYLAYVSVGSTLQTFAIVRQTYRNVVAYGVVDGKALLQATFSAILFVAILVSLLILLRHAERRIVTLYASSRTKLRNAN